MKSYVLLGLGNIAERHLKAIKETGGQLALCYDPYTSVGKIDKYFNKYLYLSDKHAFQTILDNSPVTADYGVICTPNYCHVKDIENLSEKCKSIICEKPLVIDYDDYKSLGSIRRRIYPVFQLRASDIQNQIKKAHNKYDFITVDYLVHRGPWYDHSWQTEKKKSGGIIWNIGIHIIDLLCSVYGYPKSCNIICKPNKRQVSFEINYKKAECLINLSTIGDNTRKMTINTTTIDLSKGFENLHTEMYIRINTNNWITANDIRSTIETCHELSKNL